MKKIFLLVLLPLYVFAQKTAIDTYIQTQIPDNTQQLIKPVNIRNVTKRLNAEGLNLRDGGNVVESLTGYKTQLTPSDNRHFTTKKYVDDAITGVSGDYYFKFQIDSLLYLKANKTYTDSNYIPKTGTPDITGNLFANNLPSFKIGESDNNRIAFIKDAGYNGQSSVVNSPDNTNHIVESKTVTNSGSNYSISAYSDTDTSSVNSRVFQMGNGLKYSFSKAQITGSDYFSPTSNNDYVQKQYVDSSIAAGGGGGGSTYAGSGSIAITGSTNKISVKPDFLTLDTSGTSNTLQIKNSGVTNAKLANSSITIAGNSTSLGGSVTQDQITGLGSNGLVKRTAANTLGIAVAGTDYVAPSDATYVKSVVLNTPNLLFATPVNFSTAANTATGTLSLNNQTANRAFLSPIGSTGTPTFRAIDKTDLPSSVSKNLDEVGTIINENWSSLSAWTQVGTATWGVASNVLTATGGTPASPVFTNYIRNSGYGNSCYSLYRDGATVVVGTINSTSWGVYLGVQGQSSFFAVSVHAALMLDATNKGKLRIYNQNTNTVIKESAGTLGVTAGDNITLTYTQNYNQLVITAYNITTNRKNTLTVTQQEAATFNLNSNVYQHSIGIMGGTHQVLPYSVYVSTKKNLDWLFFVDSIGFGSSGNNYSTQSFIKLVAAAVHDNIDVYGGPGIRIQDGVPAELNLLGANNLVVQAGTNNQGDGDNAVTVVGRINTLRTAITGAVQGTNFYVMEIMPKSSDMSGYATQYASSFASGIIPTYYVLKSSSGTGLATDFAAPDLLHLSNYGHNYYSGVLLESLPFKKKNNFPVNDARPSFIGNKIVIGNIAAYNPTALLEVIGTASNTQVIVSSNTTTGAGMALNSAADNQAYIMAGMKTLNGTVVATATTSSGVNLLNGHTYFLGATGQTPGNASTASIKATMFASGLFHTTGGSSGGLSVGTSGNNTFRATNGGADFVGDVLFENGSTITSGTSFAYNSGALQCLASNGTRRIAVAQIGFGAPSTTAGAETGNLLFSVKPAGSAVVEALRIDAAGNTGLGTGATVSARLHARSTTVQARFDYDVSNYWEATTASTGIATFNAVGTGARFVFSDGVTFPAGTVTAGTAPLKLTAGTNLTTPEAGAIEFDGSNYFGTVSTTRYTFPKTLPGSASLSYAAIAGGAVQDQTITVTGASVGDPVVLGSPNLGATDMFFAWVSATNTVTVRRANADPVNGMGTFSGTFKVNVIKQ